MEHPVYIDGAKIIKLKPQIVGVKFQKRGRAHYKEISLWIIFSTCYERNKNIFIMHHIFLKCMCEKLKIHVVNNCLNWLMKDKRERFSELHKIIVCFLWVGACSTLFFFEWLYISFGLICIKHELICLLKNSLHTK